MAKQTGREWHLEHGDVRGATVARREFARYIDAKHPSADAAYDATLIFGELVSNAVKCARSSVCVEVVEDGWTELHVIDDGDCFDRMAKIEPPPVYSTGGRGLYLVNQLARNLDITAGERRCEVTAVLPIRSRR